MPVARNLQAPPPTSPRGDEDEAQARWQRAKLGGWLLMGLFLLSLLCSLLSRTVNEVWGLLVPPAVVVKGSQGQGRDFSSIASDKVRDGSRFARVCWDASRNAEHRIYDGKYHPLDRREAFLVKQCIWASIPREAAFTTIFARTYV